MLNAENIDLVEFTKTFFAMKDETIEQSAPKRYNLKGGGKYSQNIQQFVFDTKEGAEIILATSEAIEVFAVLMDALNITSLEGITDVDALYFKMIDMTERNDEDVAAI